MVVQHNPFKDIFESLTLLSPIEELHRKILLENIIFEKWLLLDGLWALAWGARSWDLNGLGGKHKRYPILEVKMARHMKIIGLCPNTYLSISS